MYSRKLAGRTSAAMSQSLFKGPIGELLPTFEIGLRPAHTNAMRTKQRIRVEVSPPENDSFDVPIWRRKKAAIPPFVLAGAAARVLRSSDCARSTPATGRAGVAFGQGQLSMNRYTGFRPLPESSASRLPLLAPECSNFVW